MEAHPRGNHVHDRDPECPEEPHILLDIPKLELPASALVSFPVQIQLLPHTQAGVILSQAKYPLLLGGSPG